MTVPSTRFREDYAGNGSATSFPYAFRIFKAADLVVTKTDSSGNDTTLTLGTDYTVTGAGSYNGGAVVLSTALPTSYRLTIERVLSIKQETDLRNQGEFLAETHEDAFDRLTMIVQRLAGYLGMGQDGTLRTLLLGTGDVDGAGAFRARGNRISGLGDPVDDTDAAGKRWTQEQIASAVNVDGSSMLGVFAITVDTIVGASGLLWPDKATVIARGRDTVGDGAGGQLRFLKGSTAPADGGTVYEVPGGRLVREGWSVFGVDIRWYGFKADWNGTTGTSNASKFLQIINNLSVKKITGAPGKYWFGNIVGDTALATVSRPLTIDWNGAEIFIGETNPTAANTSSAFIKVLNSGGFVMKGYEFTDTTFDYANNSRGIEPVSIVNNGNNVTYGYEVGDFYVRKGQSTLTAFSENPGFAIAKGIRFTGNCRGGQVYYGVNLAYSGDDCKGRITVDNVHRLAFVYDVDDVDLELHAYNTEPSSANLLIAGNGTRKTQNINIRAVLDVINGGVLISGLSTTTNPGQFENITLDVFAKTAGANAGTSGALVRIGVQDASGNWVATNNYSLSNIHVKARSLFKYSLGMVGVMTRGNNIGRISVDADSFSPIGNAGDYRNTTMCFKLPGNRTIVSNSGNLQTDPVKLNLQKIIPTGPKNIFGTLRVTSVVSDTNMTIKEYRIAGFLSSDGTHNLPASGVSLVNSFQIGTYNPTITVSTDFITYNVGASAGGNTSAYTIVEFVFSDGTS